MADDPEKAEEAWMAEGAAAEKRDAEAADAEVARITAAIAQNRRAVAAGAITAFAVASAVFWAIAYGFPDSDLGLPVLAAALGTGAFLGLVVWMVLRARAPVFERVTSAPEATDAETRALEEKARAHDRKNRIAVTISGALFAVLGPGALYAYDAHLEALNRTRDYWEREEIGFGTGTLILAAAAAVAALAWWMLRAKVDVLASLGGSDSRSVPEPAIPGKAPSPEELERQRREDAEQLADLKKTAAEVRASQRREMLAHAGSVAAFFVACGIVLFLDGGVVLGAIVGGGAALFVNRLATPRPPAPPPVRPVREGERDWFKETMSTTGTLVLQVPADLGSFVLRGLGMATNQWSVLDGGSGFVCEVAEVELPFFRRLVPGHARTIEVRDVDRTPMVLKRPFSLFGGDWEVTADGAKLGTIAQRFFGGLELREASGVVRLRVRRSWLSRRVWIASDARGTEKSRIERARPSFFATAMEVPGLHVGLPRDAGLDDRRLLLAAALVLDLDRA
jgi:hypothetical protein